MGFIVSRFLIFRNDFHIRTTRYCGKPGKLLDCVEILSMISWATIRVLNLLLQSSFDFSKGSLGFDASNTSIDEVVKFHSSWQSLATYHDLGEPNFVLIALFLPT